MGNRPSGTPNSDEWHGRRLWRDLTQDERDDLAVFLLAVNSEIAFADGKMAAREADVDRIFQVVLSRSRGSVVREALFHLHDNYDRLGAMLMPMLRAGPGGRDFVGPRVGRAREILETIEQEEMRRYVRAVFFIGVATGEADGPWMGPKFSKEERDRLDTIMYSLGLPLARSEEALTEWLARPESN